MHLDGNINIAITYSLSCQDGCHACITPASDPTRVMYENVPLPFKSLLTSALTDLSWPLLTTVTTAQLGKGGTAATQTPQCPELPPARQE